MIHGIYVRNKPKNKWHLFSVTMSQEIANNDLEEAKRKAKLEGHEQAEVAIKIFESAFHIPEFMSEIQNQKPMFN